MRCVEVPSHFSLLHLCLCRVSQQWVSSPLSADQLSGINDHHVQLCRLLTAQEYLAKEANWARKVNSVSILQTHSRPGDEGPLLLKALSSDQVMSSSTTATHRGCYGLAETPHRCRSPLPSHQGGSAALCLQGRREGTGPTVAGSSPCSRLGQRTLFRVL